MRNEETIMKTRTLILLATTFCLSGAVVTTSAAPPPYKVVDGTKVDGQTLAGWKTWRPRR